MRYGLRRDRVVCMIEDAYPESRMHACKGWLGGMSASPMRSQAQSVIAVQASSVSLSQRNTAG